MDCGGGSGDLPEIPSLVYADSVMKTITYSEKPVLVNEEVRILIARAWEAGFGAARASKPAYEEITARHSQASKPHFMGGI